MLEAVHIPDDVRITLIWLVLAVFMIGAGAWLNRHRGE